MMPPDTRNSRRSPDFDTSLPPDTLRNHWFLFIFDDDSHGGVLNGYRKGVPGSDSARLF